MGSIDHDRVARLREALLEAGNAPATVNLTLVALRGVARSARNLDVAARSSADRGGAEAARHPVARRTRGGAARDEALLDTCATNPGPEAVAGRRDAAVLALLAYTGLRRSEVASLDVASCVFGQHHVCVSAAKATRSARCRWPRRRSAHSKPGSPRAGAQGKLFRRVDRNGTILEGGLSDNAISRIVTRRREEADTETHAARLPAHLGGALLDEDVDLVTVQALAGHADPKTTARYDRRGAAAKTRAIGALARAGAGVDEDASDA